MTRSILGMFALAMLVSACASAPNPGASAPNPDDISAAELAALDSAEAGLPVTGSKLRPSRRLDLIPRPILKSPTRQTGTGSPKRASITVVVEIDTAGKPDLSTLRLAGMGTAEHRGAIRQWIADGSYSPAVDPDGRPARSYYRTTVGVSLVPR